MVGCILSVEMASVFLSSENVIARMTVETGVMSRTVVSHHIICWILSKELKKEGSEPCTICTIALKRKLYCAL